MIVTRTGMVEDAIGEPQMGLAEPVLAPDGRRVAVGLGARPERHLDLRARRAGARG